MLPKNIGIIINKLNMENALPNVRLFIKIFYRSYTILHNKGEVYENEEITQDKMPVDRADRRNGDQQHDRSGHRIRRPKGVYVRFQPIPFPPKTNRIWQP